MIFVTSCSRAQSSSFSNGQDAVNMIKEFYKNYIMENAKTTNNTERINELKRKYCTEKLLDKMAKDELDYDPILNAQDCDIKWLNTLSVTKDSLKMNRYTVSYIDNYSKRKNTVRLLVVKEHSIFKIDAIIE